MTALSCLNLAKTAVRRLSSVLSAFCRPCAAFTRLCQFETDASRIITLTQWSYSDLSCLSWACGASRGLRLEIRDDASTHRLQEKVRYHSPGALRGSKTK